MTHVLGLVPLDDPSLEEVTQEAEDRGADTVREAAGYRCVTDGTVVEDDGIIVAVNGYVTTHDIDELLDIYRDRGAGLFSAIDGRYRIVVLDDDHDRAYVATDRTNNLPTFHSAGIAAGSKELLLAAGVVDPVVNDARVYQYLRAPQAHRSGGPTLVAGIEQLYGSMYRELAAGRQQLYDDWYRRGPVQVSDEEATERLDAGLQQAAADLTEDTEDIHVLFSGGLDSSVLLSYLDEHGSAQLQPVTMRFPGEDIGEARAVAAEYGYDIETVDLPRSLPGPGAVWEYGAPVNFALHFDYQQVAAELPGAVFAGGDQSLFPFPVGHDRFRTLQRLSVLRKPVRLVARPWVREMVHRFAGRRARKAIDVLADDTVAAAMTNAYNLAGSEKEELVELPDDVERPEDEIDQVWELERGKGFAYNYQYLQYRQMEATDVSVFLRGIPYRDLYDHPAVRGYALGLPLDQRRGRRLMRRLAQGRVPERVRGSGPSGRDATTHSLGTRLRADRDTYEDRIERFMDRGYLEDGARELLLGDQRTFGELTYSTAVYMLEAWMEGLERYDR